MLDLGPYLNPYQQSPEPVRTTKSLTFKKLAPVAIMMFFVLTTSFTEPSGFSTDTCNTATGYGCYEENGPTDDSE
jgi:hypothetical protein